MQCVSPTLFVSCTSSSGCCISEERKTDRYPEREREGAPVHLRSAALSMSEWDPTPGAGLTSMDHACWVFYLSIYYLSLVGPPSSSRRTSLTHRRTRTHAGASPDVQQGPYCRLPCPPVPYPTHCFRASLRFDFLLLSFLRTLSIAIITHTSHHLFHQAQSNPHQRERKAKNHPPPRRLLLPLPSLTVLPARHRAPSPLSPLLARARPRCPSSPAVESAQPAVCQSAVHLVAQWRYGGSWLAAPKPAPPAAPRRRGSLPSAATYSSAPKRGIA